MKAGEFWMSPLLRLLWLLVVLVPVVDPRVARELAGMQVLRPDVTANDAQDQALMRAWQAIGPPTLLLIGPDGQERRAERTVGEVDTDAFLTRLQRARRGDIP